MTGRAEGALRRTVAPRPRTARPEGRRSDRPDASDVVPPIAPRPRTRRSTARLRPDGRGAPRAVRAGGGERPASASPRPAGRPARARSAQPPGRAPGTATGRDDRPGRPRPGTRGAGGPEVERHGAGHDRDRSLRHRDQHPVRLGGDHLGDVGGQPGDLHVQGPVGAEAPGRGPGLFVPAVGQRGVGGGAQASRRRELPRGAGRSPWCGPWASRPRSPGAAGRRPRRAARPGRRTEQVSGAWTVMTSRTPRPQGPGAPGRRGRQAGPGHGDLVGDLGHAPRRSPAPASGRPSGDPPGRRRAARAVVAWTRPAGGAAARRRCSASRPPPARPVRRRPARCGSAAGLRGSAAVRAGVDVSRRAGVEVRRRVGVDGGPRSWVALLRAGARAQPAGEGEAGVQRDGARSAGVHVDVDRPRQAAADPFRRAAARRVEPDRAVLGVDGGRQRASGQPDRARPRRRSPAWSGRWARGPAAAAGRRPASRRPAPASRMAVGCAAQACTSARPSPVSGHGHHPAVRTAQLEAGQAQRPGETRSRPWRAGAVSTSAPGRRRSGPVAGDQNLPAPTATARRPPGSAGRRRGW